MSAIDELLARATAPPAHTGPAPTGQQQAIIEAFTTGEHLKVEAGAGTGKTTTLAMAAETSTAPGRYLAFNKAISVEAGSKMPRNVASSTAHSLAWHAVVRPNPHLADRMTTPRLRPGEVADILAIDTLVLHTSWGRRHLAPWRLAGMVQRALAAFCRSTDEEPGPQHFEWQDGLDGPGSDEHNRALAEHLTPALERAWADLSAPDGHLPYDHDHYLKAYALSHPRLECAFVMLDEAQDSNPVIAQIVEEQLGHAQVMVVGDSAQQIYEWNGAVNAIERYDIDRRLWLTQSFRFGPAVAEVANRILAAAGLELRISGNPDRLSAVERLERDETDAVLCRTNAGALTEVLAALEAGRRPALVGDGRDILQFVYGASKLQQGERTTHRELACFDTWAEVQDYVESDGQGRELKMLVKLVDRFSCRTLIRVLQHELAREHDADVTISTAHKAKGREWPRVRLSPDLAVERDPVTGELPIDEMRLLYVAATRARDILDVGDVPLTWPTDGDVEAWAGGEW